MQTQGGISRRAFLQIGGLSLIGCGVPGLLKAQREEKSPRFLLEWGKRGKAEGEFDPPIGIAINRADEVFVTEFRNNRVQKFTADGKYLRGFGQQGSGPGEFLTPHGLAVDSRGHLYVVDAQNCRVQKFAV